MRNNFYLLIIIFMSYVNLSAHEEYFKLNTTTHRLDPETATRTQIQNYSKKPVRWIDYYDNRQGAKIPIEILASFGLGWLSQSTVETACQNAMNTWNSTAPSGENPFQLHSGSASVKMEVTDDAMNFANPSYASGTTNHAVDYVTSSDPNLGYVPSILQYAGSPQTQDHHDNYISNSKIYLNNTTEFTFMNMTWVHSQDPASDEVDIEHTALHELGHLVGLNHCSSSHAVMYSHATTNNEGWNLHNLDIEGIQNLYLLPITTGLEDGITIDSGPGILYEYDYVTYSATFWDFPPVGAWIIEWDWEIALRHNEGVYILASGSTLGAQYTEWQVQLGELPVGYDWQIDDNGRISGSVILQAYDSEGYEHVSTGEIGFFIPSLPSTITQNMTINKYYIVDNDVNLTNEAILTIGSGTHLFFENDRSITVNNSSKIIANGTSELPIRFKRSNSFESWNRILLVGNENSFSYCIFDGGNFNVDNRSNNNVFNNCTFKNATRGINFYNATNGSVSNSIFQNNGYGIYLYESNPTLSYNTITNSTNEGIYMSSSSPVLKNNSIINNNDNGIFAYGGSPKFGTGIGANGYNIITDNSGIGIYAVSSNINMGTCVDCHSDGGKNSVYNNNISDCSSCHGGSDEVNVWASDNSDVDAEGNWWGSNPPLSSAFIKDESSSIDYTPWLSSDPNKSKSKSSQNNLAISLSKSTENFDHSQLSGFEYGRYKQFNKDYLGAIKEYEKVINQNFLLINSRYALRNISDCYFSSRQPGLGDYLENIVNRYPGSELCKLALQLKSDLYVEMGRYNDAISVNNTMLKQYPKDDILKRNALYNKFMIYFINLNDTTNAIQTFSEMKHLYQPGILCMGDKFISHINDMLNNGSNIKFENSMAQVIDIPTEFNLFNNYPNPFNPSTTITFELPKYSQVEIVIYDALGKKIKTLLSENMETGSHNTVWNGTNQSGQQVSSGIYFYTFKAKALDESKETFAKSAKLLLLR